MRAGLSILADEHRPIEAALDRLGHTAAAGQLDVELLHSAAEAIAQHYAHEEEFLVELHLHEPALSAKLRGQHDEVLELLARLDESLGAGNAGDVSYLVRRFLAIAQHNMIEEERDVFPLAERF
jgi:hypothetical protein